MATPSTKPVISATIVGSTGSAAPVGVGVEDSAEPLDEAADHDLVLAGEVAAGVVGHGGDLGGEGVEVGPATLWRVNMSDEMRRTLAQVDVHSPGTCAVWPVRTSPPSRRHGVSPTMPR